MKKIDVTQPYAMTSPFADGVYSSVSTSDFEIPADTSTAPDDTCVIDDGFLPITSTDLDDGGIAPERKNFNGMFYLSTDQRFFLQNGGFITYNSNVATAIGGYPQDAILSFINSQGTYKLVRSLIDDNTNDFTQDETLIDGIHWEEIEMGGGSGYQMFDIVMKDHVLSYEETLGLAPLGTYVYKEAIAGTRYGYPDFYQKLVDEYNDLNNTTDTVDSVTVTINANGHKFYDIADKATFDNMYAITGEAWYYGIDTTNERVFLPRSTRFKNGTSADVGGYQAAGLPNITGQVGYYSRNTELATTGSLYRVNEQWVGTGGGGGGQYVAGIGIDASLSSSIYGASNTVEYSSTKLIPYMVVGNQSTWSGMTDVVNQGMTILSQVNAGLATKVDLDGSNATFPHITETYENGTSWYRVYSDGWCEQGGQIVQTGDAYITVSFLKPFINTNYVIFKNQPYDNFNPESGYHSSFFNYTTSSAQTRNYTGENSMWQACGYIS